MRKGTVVKMSEELKELLINNDCKAHVDEFGECEGVVIGLTYPELPDCEVDVRWKPSDLKYGYLPKDLIVIEDYYFYGYIIELDEESLIGILKRDYCLHKELDITLNLLSDEQKSHLCVGRVLRYDEESGLIEYRLPEEDWRELITIFETED